jgi:hypothetical protein
VDSKCRDSSNHLPLLKIPVNPPYLKRHIPKCGWDFANLAGCRCKRAYQQLFEIWIPNSLFYLI